jgi:acyl-CoA dehydrogenase
MEYKISAEVEDVRARIAAFVARELLPLETDRSSFDPHENIRLDLLEQLRARARAEGLWCLQLKPETGGLGFGKMGMAVCYEAMNRSIFGPVVFNSAAPDDGNMMVLEAVGTPEQKERWLQPIVRGDVRSAFAMTEPGAGRRLRPFHDPDPGREAEQQRLRGARAQVVYHRSRGSRSLHPDGSHLG